MSGSKPDYPAPEPEPSRPGTETRVKARGEAEKTLPPSNPSHPKRRALLLVEGDGDSVPPPPSPEDDDPTLQGYDAVLTDAEKQLLEDALYGEPAEVAKALAAQDLVDETQTPTLLFAHAAAADRIIVDSYESEFGPPLRIADAFAFTQNAWTMA